MARKLTPKLAKQIFNQATFDMEQHNQEAFARLPSHMFDQLLKIFDCDTVQEAQAQAEAAVQLFKART
jgi:hypothetical protein